MTHPHRHSTHIASGVAATLAVLSLAACSDTNTRQSLTAPSVARASQSQTGNGGPSGSHFNLNIIGMDKGKNVDMTGNDGHRIFVALNGRTNINLTEGDFQVLDANGTDGSAAFQLPNPVGDADGDGVDDDGVLNYSVWIRALGKPGGKATLKTCFTELETASTWCNSGELVVKLNRLGSSSKFVDVSKQLLQVCADVNTALDVTDLELVPIFSDLGTDYFWQYDNDGLRLAQMRFYPIATTAIGGDCTRSAP
jgi:hypothetical protein